MSKEQFGDQYVEFLLGTLDPVRSRALEKHVQECGECRDHLAELEETLHSLPLALPEQVPPPELLERIQTEIRSSTSGSDWLPASVAFWRYGFVAASLAALTLGALAVYFYQLSLSRESTIALLERESAQLRATNQSLDQKINQLTRPRLRYMSLAGLENYEGVEGSAFLDPQESEVRLYVWNLPTAQENRQFQLWVIEAGEPPHPSRVFQSAGRITEVEVDLPIEADRVQTLAITIEPGGGSPQPTGPMVAAGTL